MAETHNHQQCRSKTTTFTPCVEEDHVGLAVRVVGEAIRTHLNASCCPLGGGIVKMPRKEVEAALLALDPRAAIEEVNHQGTPLVVYRGTIPGAGDYTFAVEAESMIQAELRLRTAMNN